MSQKGSGANRGNTSQLEEFKVVIVGDRGCGKTSLLTVYTTGAFPEEYVPSVFDKSVVNTRYRGQHLQLHLYDTAGQEDYDRLRPLSYYNVNVVLICYDVMCPSSFDNVFIKLPQPNRVPYLSVVPEVQHFCLGVPIILVGCKGDLRTDKALTKKLWASGQNVVTYIQGEEAKRKLNAVLYMECSAKYRENVDDLFRQAAKQALTATRAPDKVKERGLCALF
ncbi:Rho-related GTP-binding protein RhoF Rho family GTPase Rif Rho in filopodia Precursor [Larimichthys crocea]|uniref:Rho-related GTP-binding protein RhoF Rho family GTPase Rif Rho in filopodia n=1 Tax=Larimichthys crocea TaxID=215358 RepID=A0A6G0IM57_LARCR|nr:Rho-related GTP-binding protein RhoF Rho family GTPase Rif Rho in filopodia Precursor [Larimichthys crocea]